MRVFWLLFGWLAVVWIVLFVQIDPVARTGVYFACAAFFTVYFMVPLLRTKTKLLFVALSASMLITAFTVTMLRDELNNGPILLTILLTYLVAEAIYRLPTVLAGLYGAITGTVLLLVIALIQAALVVYGLLCVAAIGPLLIYYTRLQENYRESRERYEALIIEYRQLRRNAKVAEDDARLEERTNIARQIHDSVGHKLTSLLMQLEMFRLQGDSGMNAEQMKQLAQESLDETRKAVKALNEQEPGGIPAIIRLIRNLETENYLQVDFSFRYGALSTVLSSEQSVAAYRAIQEALTNAMRHGAARKVSVMLESPGSRVFRFEVMNDVPADAPTTYRAGFGLTAMRERIEQAGGTLEIQQLKERFIVRGTFLLA